MAKRPKMKKSKTKKNMKKNSGKKTKGKGKRKTVLSVKSGKGSAKVEMKGLRPVAGTASYGKSEP